MTPQRRTLTVRFDDELLNGLQEVWHRDGVPVSEQVRRAVQKWLEEKGVTVKADRKRVGTRQRP